MLSASAPCAASSSMSNPPPRTFARFKANTRLGEYNGFSATFTGDMSSFAEKNLIDDGKAGKTNLLKVAHHGSNTATCEEWVEKLTPEYAVISVSENNPYNLPNDDVLERL